MKKFLLIILLFISSVNFCSAQLGTYAGAFSRMGFGARGLAMGNAMVGNIYGDINGIYNPALSTFQNDGLVTLGYSFLTLDRNLNFLGFTKKIMLPNQKSGGAGIVLAWINAGVDDIDGRDNDTRQIGMLSTFENEFYLGTAFILSDQISAGIGFKLYYAKLYTDITATSFAIDIGGIYKANDKLSLGLTVKDLGAKYEWQTSQIYGSNGNTTEDKFPVLVDLGATYVLPKDIGLASLGLQQYFNPNVKLDTFDVSAEKSDDFVMRLGFEFNVVPQVKLRAGLDRINLAAEDFTGNLEPTFGVGLNKNFSKTINLGIDYSFQLEPFTHKPLQNIGIVFKFK